MFKYKLFRGGSAFSIGKVLRDRFQESWKSDNLSLNKLFLYQVNISSILRKRLEILRIVESKLWNLWTLRKPKWHFRGMRCNKMSGQIDLYTMFLHSCVLFITTKFIRKEMHSLSRLCTCSKSHQRQLEEHYSIE